MRILVSNDDGIEAPGIGRLVKAASTLSDDVWVVAPDGKRTAAGTSITIARPLEMQCIRPQWYACSGTPADCVVTAMTWLFADSKQPDLVVSGVNDGPNVAEDLAYSGTLGIAREAAFWGVPAIGFSQVKSPEFGDGDDEWLGAVLASLWRSRESWWLEGHWLSINLPKSLPARFTQPIIGRDKIACQAQVLESDGSRTVLQVPRGRSHASQAGDENAAIASGMATVNRLNWFGQTRMGEEIAGLSQI